MPPVRCSPGKRDARPRLWGNVAAGALPQRSEKAAGGRPGKVVQEENPQVVLLPPGGNVGLHEIGIGLEKQQNAIDDPADAEQAAGE